MSRQSTKRTRKESKKRNSLSSRKSGELMDQLNPNEEKSTRIMVIIMRDGSREG